MKLDDIKTGIASLHHEITRERETGRHRGEPKHRLGPLIVLGTVVSLLCVAIVTVFIVQQNPEPALPPAQYHSSSPAFVPKPQVFPPRAAPATAPGTYTARHGDSLWSIAFKECGNGTKWGQLARANKIWWPWVVPTGKAVKIDC